ncbi:aldehyde dehydrogenase family protein [Mycobacterium pseudokansasii]|uniref:Putative succinate-semialdehyde dehydrogenase [NADP(+)] 2 n=1 Tax=Mycobacterium pseudokansasii TaxID=2341080 RepID=A0A498QT21_9MYCO|nr:aldehyde dehydrogenase family protein [Mycobacterium pseudokansasii]VBA52212.1 NAD/NADP-dependent betaine aldehyde dehydrogenase [Mycobacterium pseudokansasii]
MSETRSTVITHDSHVAGEGPVLTIGGEPQPGAAGTYPVHNPARPAEIVGHAPAADRAQLDAAVSAARRAAPAWRALGVAERVAALTSAATTAAQQLAARDGARLYTREHGKVLGEANFEISTGPGLAALIGSMAAAALAPEQLDPRSAYPRLQREPFGVAALVLPFNWPLALTMTKLTSALTAGNTAVVKVPPTCPLAALELAGALAAALPPGVVNVLAGPGSDLAQALVTHPGIDLISLTGGVATGRAVMAAAAVRLTPVLLELGGNDAAIIAPDLAVSDELVERLVTATYTTGGQVCMAIKRLYAPVDRAGELAEAVLARCEREVVGDGLAEETTLGPLHTAAGRNRVTALVGDAEARGASVRTAGRIREADADAAGYFVLPTVVTDLVPDSALATQEQFGPVLPIFGYDDLDDAVTAANATEFGLTASVWTGDDALADRVASQLVAGTVSVNCHGLAAQDPRLPFGGCGQSGIGREFGIEGIRAFTQARAFVRHPVPR